MILFLVPVALALDCAELQQMSSIGLEPAHIASVIRPCDVSESELQCLVDAGASAIVLDAVRQSIADCSTQGPAETAVDVPAVVPEAAVARSGYALPRAYFEAPEPAAAVGLAVGLGFGAGHFYARDTGTAVTILLLDLASVGLLAGGIAGGDAIMVKIGGVGLGGTRLFEICDAPFAATRTRRTMLSAE